LPITVMRKTISKPHGEDMSYEYVGRY